MPADKLHQDLDALRILHRAHTIELLHAHEQLATPGPGWRQRRLLAKAIHHHQQALTQLQRQLAQRNPHPPAITADHRPPETPPSPPPTTRPAALQPAPPRYLVAELGGWPRTPAAQAIWRLAASRIQAYRASAGVTDPKTALGPEPDDPHQRAQHQAVAELIQNAVHAIDTIEGPALPGLGDDAASVEPP